MVRRILMFYHRGCADANLMMPAVTQGLGRSGKYEIELYETGSENEKKVFAQYKDLIKKDTGKDSASPIFVDPEGNKAIFAPNFEKLLGWLEGPNWWKENHVRF